MPKRAVATYHAPRVVHYLQPTPTPSAELLIYTAAQLATQRHERELAYARWATRHAIIAEHDRRTRRILLRIVGVITLVILAACTALGWMVYHALATANLSGAATIGAVIIGALALAGLVVGGQRCITIVEHRH